MNQDLENALRLVAVSRRDAILESYYLNNLFTKKINLLISRTPTGEHRNELSELNIIYEKMLSNNEFISKLGKI